MYWGLKTVRNWLRWSFGLISSLIGKEMAEWNRKWAWQESRSGINREKNQGKKNPLIRARRWDLLNCGFCLCSLGLDWIPSFEFLTVAGTNFSCLRIPWVNAVCWLYQVMNEWVLFLALRQPGEISIVWQQRAEEDGECFYYILKKLL